MTDDNLFKHWRETYNSREQDKKMNEMILRKKYFKTSLKSNILYIRKQKI